MFYIFKEFCNRRCSFNILSTTQKKIKGVVWVLKHGNSMQELTSCYSNCSTRFKGTATLGSPGDSRYPDELVRWTKSFRESASESQVSLLRLLGWHKIPPHFTLCKNNDKCPVEMRREDGS
jgi:hypothetical protein